MKRSIAPFAVLVSSCVVLTETVQAGHYVPGVEGINAPVVPPPGVYYRGYAVNYRADSGSGIPGDSEVEVNALANRFVWVTEHQVLGADIAFETVIPVISTDLNIANGIVNSDETGIGDIMAGGVLAWHGDRYDVAAALSYWFEVGDDDLPADPGLGYEEVMVTLGGSYKLTEDKRTQISLLARYEIPQDNDFNQEMVLEWSLHYLLNNGITVGVSGYDQWDLESGSNGITKHAIGLEGGYFWPSVMFGLNVAYYQEYDTENTFEGDVLRATFTKRF